MFRKRLSGAKWGIEAGDMTERRSQISQRLTAGGEIWVGGVSTSQAIVRVCCFDPLNV
jgi:hypothetical protein